MPVTNPANPRADQLAKRLQDFRRLREFLDLYARDGTLRIADIPQPDRAEAEAILDRVGDLDTRRNEERQKMLLDIARVEGYLDDLAADPGNHEEVRRLRREYGELRARLTGLPPEASEDQP